MLSLRQGILIFLLLEVALTKALNIAFWIDSIQKDINDDIASTLKEIEGLHLEADIHDSVLVVESNNEKESENLNKFCEILSTEGVSVVIDFTYHQWKAGIDYVTKHNLPYLRVDRILSPFLQMFGVYLQQKGANDVAMIFQDTKDKDEALYHMLEGFPFRTMLLDASVDLEFVRRLRDLRPSPAYYAIFARGTNMNTIFEKINNGNLFERAPEWHFIFLDPRDRVFKYKKQVEFATKFTVNAKALCRSLQMKDSYCLSGFTFQRGMLLEIFRSLIDLKQSNMNWLEPVHIDCNDTSTAMDKLQFDILEHFRLTNFLTFTAQNSNDDDPDFIPSLTYSANISINFFSNEHEAVTDLAAWQAGELRKINQTISPAKRFFRIGSVESIPWNYYRRDSHTGKIVVDRNGKPIWEGYCIDFVQTLSEKLNFDYELIAPKSGRFGERDPQSGHWNGIVGDLVSGETDFAVTALKMYSDREEVIDFIAPYYEQTGISIVIRKPVRQTSLFKFMTVLRLEVWLSIIAALVATAIMIWLMDKYSPYSSRNNKEAYPYPCREFTLRESFWFALTSFTPQGGGEAPKAISGRILVAAYWLFVVLMLATFTANLAAFLTVERMQTPVASLEQLARQSRINYTVVEGSDTHQYFINMKFAEDTLYRMWKELALNASADYHKFRIWDYPIKEQYGHILLAINTSEPVRDAAEGFRNVNEHENADFAFIHDSSEIQYQITMNCNLTEVGEVFAEQPLAIAVQQGSHLADEFSYAILELQKDRYFEELHAKFWNRSRQSCPLSEDQEGITLESLGGVFIATLFGLGLAMLTLGLEVFYYKRRHPAGEVSNQITKVKPVSALSPARIEAWHTGNDVSSLNNTPPPSFESATFAPFRGKKIPPSITLGGEEFKPRRIGLKSRRGPSASFKSYDDGGIPNSDLPPYTE